MKESKFLRVLKKTDADTYDRFLLFLESPYFNRNTVLSKLGGLLRPFVPGKTLTETEQVEVFGSLYPGKPYREEALTKLYSKLFKLFSDFLLHEDPGGSRDLALLKYYRSKELADDFTRLSNRMTKANHKPAAIAPDGFHDIYLLEEEYNRFVSTRADKGSGDARFQEAMLALDRYYYFKKIIYECQTLNRKRIVRNFDIPEHSNAVLPVLTEGDFETFPILGMWRLAHEMLKDESLQIKRYEALKKALLQGPQFIPASQSRILFTYVENAAIRLFPNRDALYKELLSLYDHQLEYHGLLNEETGVFRIVKNYVTVCLNLRKLDHAERFLLENETRIQKTAPEIFRFSQAMILFERERFEKTLDVLNTFSPNHIVLKINERVLRLKLYHELGYSDLLMDTINSFRVFLTNNKKVLSNRMLESNRHFLSHLTSWVKFHGLKDEKAKAKLELEQDQITVEKRWLLKIFQG